MWSNVFKTLATSNSTVLCCEGTFNTAPNWDIIGLRPLNLHLCAPPPPLALSSHSAANLLLVSSPPAARLRRVGVGGGEWGGGNPLSSNKDSPHPLIRLELDCLCVFMCDNVRTWRENSGSRRDLMWNLSCEEDREADTGRRWGSVCAQHQRLAKNAKVSTWFTGSVGVGKKNWVFRNSTVWHWLNTLKGKTPLTYPPTYTDVLVLFAPWVFFRRRVESCRCDYRRKRWTPGAVRSAQPRLEVITACVQTSPAVNNISTVWPHSLGKQV